MWSKLFLLIKSVLTNHKIAIVLLVLLLLLTNGLGLGIGIGLAFYHFPEHLANVVITLIYAIIYIPIALLNFILALCNRKPIEFPNFQLPSTNNKKVHSSEVKDEEKDEPMSKTLTLVIDEAKNSEQK